MEEEVKPIRQQQRRMNPTILDVVKKEVTKLLAIGIIYPISDSQWVSPVQVVPKKSGMTVTKNQHDELVPMSIQNSWRVCIDYRRLNQATRKDHFPLPFIDQFLEKLLGKSHYFFLDCFSGYISTQDHLHLPIWYLCVHSHAIWPVQRAEYISMLHDKHFLGPATGVHGCVHG
ncbi:Retrovirus-related Pol polyprotein, partial [Mucuna pruriens]